MKLTQVALLLSVLACWSACAGTAPRSPCSVGVDELREAAGIEAAYIAEATTVCAGKSYDACPALPGLREVYRARRAEFIRCHR